MGLVTVGDVLFETGEPEVEDVIALFEIGELVIEPVL